MNNRITIAICFVLTMFITNSQTNVQATLGSVNRPTPKFGFNTNAHIPANFPTGYSGANWTQQWFIDSTAYLKPEILRYPGGTNANHWDWKTGWYMPGYAPSGPTLSIRADEFKAGLLAANAEGMYVVNMETSTPNYELDGLKHARSIGLDPKYIELGNEHNLNGGTQFPLQLMTPQNYSQLAKSYYDVIRAEFPNAKICAVGGNTPTISNWVASVMQDVPNIDALSFHVYINANNTSDQLFNVDRALAEPFRTGVTPTPSLDYRYNLSGFPSDKEVWVTEFNLLETPSGLPQIISQTWTHVLYNTAMNDFFLRKPNVTIILNHSLAGDNHFQSISRKDKSITANALSMKLLYDMSSGSQTCQDLNFSGKPTTTYGSTTFPKLIGWKFNHSGVEKGFICNLSSDTFTLSLATVFTNPMQFDQYYADAALVVNGISSLNKYSSNTSDTITIYPYSITQISSATTLGVQNFETDKNEMWLFPNPANKNITVQTKADMNNADVYIYDMTGKEIQQFKNVLGNSFSIPVDKFSKGVYVIKINTSKSVMTSKIIID